MLGGLSGMGGRGATEGWTHVSLATVGCLAIVAGPEAEYAQKGSGSGNEEVCPELVPLLFAEFRGPVRDRVAGGYVPFCWKEATGWKSSGRDVTGTAGFMCRRLPSREC